MFSFLFFSVSRAWQGFWRNAAMSLAATATMTLMLMLLAGFWIIQAGFLASLSYVEDKVGVVADLNDGVSNTALRDLEARLGAMPEVKSVEYTSKDQALANYRTQRWRRARKTSRRTSPPTRCRPASTSSCSARRTTRPSPTSSRSNRRSRRSRTSRTPPIG